MEPMNLFRARDLGELLQDTFRFVVQESRSFLGGLMLYVGPFYLIIGILSGLVLVDVVSVFMPFDVDITSVKGLTRILPNLLAVTLLSWKGPVLLLLSFAGTSVFYSYVYSYMQIYSREESGGVSLSKVRTLMIDRLTGIMGVQLLKSMYILLLQISLFLGTMLLMTLISVLFEDMPGVAVILSGLTGLLAIIASVYLNLPLTLIYAIEVNEEGSASSAIRRTYSLIRGHWWQTFGLVMALSMVLSFAQGLIVGGSMGGAYAIEKLGAMTLGYGILFMAVRMITNAVMEVGVGLQYYNLKEEEGEEPDSHIDDIGEDA